MGVAEIIGGAALVGVGLMIGLAIVNDGQPDTLTTPTQPTVIAADGSRITIEVSDTGVTTADSAGADSSASTVPPTTEPPETTSPPTTDAPTTTAARTTTTVPRTTTTAAPTTTVAAAPDPAEIRVQVLNGGQPSGAAQAMTDLIAAAGFDTLDPSDAPVGAGWTIVFHQPGFADAAAAINEFVGTDPALVLEGSLDDPNWSAHADDLDVLVILGAG